MVISFLSSFGVLRPEKGRKVIKVKERKTMKNNKCYLLYQKNESNNEMKLLSVYNTEKDAIFVSELKPHNRDCPDNACFVLDEGCVYTIIEENMEKGFGNQLPSVKEQMDDIAKELETLLDSIATEEEKV